MNRMPEDNKTALGEFSSHYTPKIDDFIEGFYRDKIRRAGFPFIRDCYSCLLEFCLRDGKRIRPLLLIASCRGYGRIGTEQHKLVKLASAVEIMHAFLLIHDDIIDRSELRRGGKTLHRTARDAFSKHSLNENIGNDIAIVLGDVLYSNCVEIISGVRMAPKRKDRFLEIFAKTYEMTGWGQILDSLNSMPRDLDASSESPSIISEMKTSYYTIYYPIVMGYVLTGRYNAGEMRRIEDFSIPLGMAFQYRDDILGTFETDNNTGKSSETDILEGKFTLLVKEALEKLPKREQGNFKKLFLKQKKSKKDIAVIRNYISDSGALESVKQKQGDFIRSSRERLNGLSMSARSREIVSGIIDSISVF